MVRYKILLISIFLFSIPSTFAQEGQREVGILPWLEQYLPPREHDPSYERAAQKQFAFGMLAFQGKRYVEARESFSKVIENYPLSRLTERSQFMIARSYDIVGDNQRAIDEYRKVLTTYRSEEMDADALYAIANIYREREIEGITRRGRFQLAADAYQDLINLYPDSPWVPRATFYLAELSSKLGLWERARINYRTVIEKYPSAEWQKGLPIGADAKLLTEVVDYRQGRGERVEGYLDQRRYASALKAYSKLESMGDGPYRALAIFRGAESLENLGRGEDAIRAYNRLAALESPLKPFALYNIGEIYINDGVGGISREERLRRAEDNYKKVIAIGGPEALVYFSRERLEEIKALRSIGGEPKSASGPQDYISLHKYERAIGEYYTAARDYPQSPYADDALLQMGMCYESLGLWDKAVETYQAILRDYPDGVEEESGHPMKGVVTLRLAEVYANLSNPDHQLERAAALYEEVIYSYRGVDDSLTSELAYNIGKTYEKLYDWDRMLSMYEYLVSEFPDSPRAGEVLYAIGEIYRTAKIDLFSNRERYERALEAYRQATVSAKDRNLQARAWYRWGEMLVKLNRWAEAKSKFDRALGYKGATWEDGRDIANDIYTNLDLINYKLNVAAEDIGSGHTGLLSGY
ncbi:MAG: tetratricopeptide repeat protein [bacterium]